MASRPTQRQFGGTGLPGLDRDIDGHGVTTARSLTGAVSTADVESVRRGRAAELHDQRERLTRSHSLETESLVRRARTGDSVAWSRLYALNIERLYKHLGYLTGDAAAAEDLAQEVFATAMVSLDRFDGRASFSTWLYGIARNAVYKHWRSRSRQDRAYKKVADANVDPGPAGPARFAASDPEGHQFRRQKALALESVLENLPDKLREAFILVDLRETPLDEAADMLGISRGNLSVRACRARTRIREELQLRGWIASEEG